MPSPTPRPPHHRRRPTRRLLAGLAATTLAVPLLAVPASADQHVRTAEPPVARTIDDACPQDLEAPNFADIGTTGVHVRAIRCAAFHDIARGGPGGRPVTVYGPHLVVTRDQMATFIERLVDLIDAEVADELLPAWDGVNRFTDVAGTSPHVAAVNRLAEAGIVRGGPGGRPATSFGPTLGVSRAQVATFLNRMHTTVAKGSFLPQEVYFDDLAGVTPEHAGNINALAEEGVLSGRQAGAQWRYDPANTLRRDQMASILMRGLDLLHDLGVVGHTFVEPPPAAGADPVATPGFPTMTGEPAQLVDVELADQDGSDRFVLEFDSDEVPAHSVRWVAPPVLRDGSGEPVVLPGDGYLEVIASGASGFDLDAGTPTYDGPYTIPLDGGPVHVAEQTGDFEAVLSWHLGVDRPRPFTVQALTSPARLVVDVATDCIVPPAPAPGAGEMAVTIHQACTTGDPTQSFDEVRATGRVVPQSSGVLRASLEVLLAGPTEAERTFGLGAFFGPETADMLVGVDLAAGAAVVDLDPELAVVAAGASTSAGSAAFLAELNTTVLQFPTVDSVEYRLGGDCEAFGEWLQAGDCPVFTSDMAG